MPWVLINTEYKGEPMMNKQIKGSWLPKQHGWGGRVVRRDAHGAEKLLWSCALAQVVARMAEGRMSCCQERPRSSGHARFLNQPLAASGPSSGELQAVSGPQQQIPRQPETSPARFVEHSSGTNPIPWVLGFFRPMGLTSFNPISTPASRDTNTHGFPWNKSRQRT